MNELATLRGMLALSQSALAEKLGVSLRTIQDNEAGEPRRVYVLAAKWLWSVKTGEAREVIVEEFRAVIANAGYDPTHGGSR